MPTAVELARYVGQEGVWSIPGNGLRVAVTVKDARAIFSRLELKVCPVAGSGEAWVIAENVALALVKEKK